MMKVVILAGGFGTRLSEETVNTPKPMVEIGGKPILWHLLKYFSYFGLKDFVICAGYKSQQIKDYFLKYSLINSDIRIDLTKNKVDILKKNIDAWSIEIVDTGIDSMTAERLKKISHLINDDFILTYGDGLANVNINSLIDHHKKNNKLATITAVRPPARFGALQIDEKNNSVSDFKEKPDGDNSWINGGFFVLNKNIFDFIVEKNEVWEKEPLERIVKASQLSAYKHDGFFQPMDTLRDLNVLNNLWVNDIAPWKIWV